VRASTAKRPEERIEARMDQATCAQVEGGVDERSKDGRVGVMEGDFRIGDLNSYYSAFSGTEVPCTVMCSVDQGQVLLFDQHSEKLYSSFSENVRRAPNHPE
jgi:hypothetical protein